MIGSAVDSKTNCTQWYFLGFNPQPFPSSKRDQVYQTLLPAMLRMQVCVLLLTLYLSRCTQICHDSGGNEQQSHHTLSVHRLVLIVMS